MSSTKAANAPAVSPDASADRSAVAWDDKLLQNPHAVADKQRRVQKMFAAIAPSYDLNNRVHSLWVDQYWRKKAVKLAEVKQRDVIVDVACGTGDLTLAFARRLWRYKHFEHFGYPTWKPTLFSGSARVPVVTAGKVLGIDYTLEMLPIAQAKALRAPTPSTQAITGKPQYLADTVRFLNGDAQRLPLPDGSADVVSIAFGIRNVADPAKAIREFYRVLRPGGRLIVLEFSLPTNPILRGMYNFYFRQILPRTATLISGDKSGAYKYLPESVNTFIGREQMQGMMTAAGFTDVTQHAMTFGVCICYRGIKR